MQRSGNQNKGHLINVPIMHEALSCEPLLFSHIIIFALTKCNLFKARRKLESNVARATDKLRTNFTAESGMIYTKVYHLSDAISLLT